MTNRNSQSLAALFASPSEELGPLLARVRLLQRLTSALRNKLPDPLRAHCWAAYLKNDTLVIATDSASWAAKLRYQSSVLLEALRQIPGIPPFTAIKIRIMPYSAITPGTTARPPHLPGGTETPLARSAPEEPQKDLSDALLRLAHRAKQHTGGN